jgi:hypothetical protein
MRDPGVWDYPIAVDRALAALTPVQHRAAAVGNGAARVLAQLSQLAPDFCNFVGES